MAEVQTNPETEVTQQTADQKLEKYLFGESTETETKEAPEATPENPDELDPQDLEAEAPPVEDGEFELNHEGQVKRVSKEEARKLAQMGFDYTQKTQQVAEQRKAVEEMRAALQAKLTIHPQIIEAAATVKSYETALKPYEQVDWVRLSQDDPIGYATHRAQFDQLREGFQKSANAYHQVANAAQQIEQQISQTDLQQQMGRVLEALPEWRDPARMQSDQGRIRKYLESEGFTGPEIGTIADARMLLTARKAMLYDQAMQAKKERSKAPSPALRPGAAPPRANVKTQTAEALKQLHQAKDPSRRKEAFDNALALKLGLK